MLLPSPIQAYFTRAQRAADVVGAEALHDGLQIGQHLARVQQIGEAVDHRHARVARHLLGAVVAEGAQHDAVAVAGRARARCRAAARRVRAASPASPGRARARPARTCAISKLARVRVDAFSKTMPSTRPGRRARAACRAARSARSSSARRISASIPPSGTIPEAEEVLALVGHCCRACGSSVERAIEDLDRLVDLRRCSTIERRHEAHDVAAGHREQQAAARAPAPRRRRVAVDDQPLQQATPARAARLGRDAARPAAAAPSRGARRSRGTRSSSPSSSIALLDVERGGAWRADCRRTSRRACPARTRAPPPRWPASRRSARRPPRPLASVTTSGTTPSCSRTRRTCRCGRRRSAPRRRSARRRSSVQARRSSCRKPGGGRLMPPSAWIGSTITAHGAVGDARRARAAASPNGNEAHRHSTSGPKPSRYFGWPVTLSAPIVRPWKLFSNATISMRSGCPWRRSGSGGPASAPPRWPRRPSCRRTTRPWKARWRQRLGQLQLRLDVVEVRDVQQPARLLGDRVAPAPGARGRARRPRCRRSCRGSDARRRRRARSPRRAPSRSAPAGSCW